MKTNEKKVRVGKVKKDKSGEDWIVPVYVDGKFNDDMTYYAGDGKSGKEDAEGTRDKMIKDFKASKEYELEESNKKEDSIILEQDVVINQKGKKIILEKGDRIQVIEVLNESSTWTQIESDDMLVEMLKKYLYSMPTSEDDYFKSTLFGTSTKNYNTFINIGKYGSGISNGSSFIYLEKKFPIYYDKKNSQKNLFILKGTNERNFEYIILIFIRSGKISKIILSSPSDIFGLGDGNFIKTDYSEITTIEGRVLKLSSLDSRSYFIFESSKETMNVSYGNDPKNIYAEINNSYDKTFKSLEELVSYLNKNNFVYIGIDSND